jgi:3-methyladenine DNA glycosylase AlkD
MKIVNRSFEYMAEFKYLGREFTNESAFMKKLKRILNSWNACDSLEWFGFPSGI